MDLREELAREIDRIRRDVQEAYAQLERHQATIRQGEADLPKLEEAIKVLDTRVMATGVVPKDEGSKVITGDLRNPYTPGTVGAAVWDVLGDEALPRKAICERVAAGMRPRDVSVDSVKKVLSGGKGKIFMPESYGVWRRIRPEERQG